MKIKFLALPALFITLFFFTGCTSKENFSLTMTILPQGTLSISTINDLQEASEIIRKRLNSSGIQDEKINMEVFPEKISLSINGIDTANVDLIKGMIMTPGNLGFWQTYENAELMNYLIEANNRSKEIDFGFDITPVDISAADSLTEPGNPGENRDSVAREEILKFALENPFFSLLRPSVGNDGQALPSSMIGLATIEDTATVIKILENNQISMVFPRDIMYLWSRKPYKYDMSGTLFELHAIRGARLGNRPMLDGSDIVEAKVKEEKWGEVKLLFSMNSEGANKWRNITSNNIDRCIALVIDGYVYSYPRVMNEITSGNTEITGSFSFDEASNLAVILRSGGEVIPVRLDISDMEIKEIK